MKKAVAIIIFIALLAAASPCPVTGAPAVYDYPHYIKDNAQRYIGYRAENPMMPYDMVIAYVNANVDIGFYKGITITNNYESVKALVNKNFALPDYYAPDDLVSISGGYMLRAEAAEWFGKLKADMESLGFTVVVRSGYRSYHTQKYMHSNGVQNFGLDSADRQYARAGHSEHQTGLAVDIVSVRSGGYMTSARFETTREYEWMLNNAYKYGFILRYPDGDYKKIHGYIYEPWHWRYIGVEAATKMYDDGMVMLEEYYGRYLAPGVDAAPGNGRAISPRGAELS